MQVIPHYYIYDKKKKKKKYNSREIMKNSGSYPKKASNLEYHPYWHFLISQYQAAVLLIDFFF